VNSLELPAPEPRKVRAPLPTPVAPKKSRPAAPSIARLPECAQPARAASRAEDARALADTGQFARAREICTRLIEANPLDADAHFTLGLIFAHTSLPDAAEASFRRAIYLDRGFVLAHYHCGALLQRAGNQVRARKSFENAVALLDRFAADEPVPHADGITAGELRALARMHIERIDKR
jgi:chemotaxis protein methyltransferase CheR